MESNIIKLRELIARAIDIDKLVIFDIASCYNGQIGSLGDFPELENLLKENRIKQTK